MEDSELETELIFFERGISCCHLLFLYCRGVTYSAQNSSLGLTAQNDRSLGY